MILLLQVVLLAGACVSSPAPQGGRQVEVTFVGDLEKTEHDVSGKVYILDEDTLVIDEFSYDGNGFGVYINVATKGRNLRGYIKNRIDVPYPSGTEVNSFNISILCMSEYNCYRVSQLKQNTLAMVSL